MDRIQLILSHPSFEICVNKNKIAEKGRKFCKHNLTHFLDVARISAILNLEYNLQIEKEILYACGLLHDIGKWQQYENGTPHEKSSAILAEVILKDCDFSAQETKTILETILSHRHLEIHGQPKNLNELFYLADKKSRPCFVCKNEADCNWPKKQKNNSLLY